MRDGSARGKDGSHVEEAPNVAPEMHTSGTGTMHLPVEVALPFLWGDQVFQKSEWGFLNFLVGPNGTGKTRFAEQLIMRCEQEGLTTRYLNAERLYGLESADVSFTGYRAWLGQGLDISRFDFYTQNAVHKGFAFDAFVVLQKKLDIRVKIEASLSQLFARRIRLVEEGGFLKPTVQRLDEGDEYGLKEGESQGLKELITLLTFLYDDTYSCLIIDEPELHLHPQLQTFLLQEMRKLAGDPRADGRKKCFFIITHSPYVIDIRTTEDLRHCVVFHQGRVPAYIDMLNGEDERALSRLLPRLNTHHKQFFFASRPIFVEGYFDQQLFALIQEKRAIMLGASGSSIIDVSGKGDLDLFFRLCRKLAIDAQVVTDLDILIEGRLRRSVSKDDRCKAYSQEQGLGEDLMRPLGQMEHEVTDCVKAIEANCRSFPPTDISMQTFVEALCATENIGEKRYIFLLGLRNVNDQIRSLIPAHIDRVKFIGGRLSKLLGAFESCGVFLLPNGELENHLPTYTDNPYTISDNAKLMVFKRERDYLLGSEITPREMRSRYGELTTVLDKATLSTSINVDKYLSAIIGDWIHKVQSAYKFSGISDVESLKTNAAVEWPAYTRIMDIVNFSATGGGGFKCTAKLKPSVDEQERSLEFTSETVAANFELQE
jgi:hypothetical protein